MSAIYTNLATFEVARNTEHGLTCFGVWRGGTTVDFRVSERGKPNMETFDNARTARLYFDLVNERLDAEEANFQRRALHEEQPD